MNRKKGKQVNVCVCVQLVNRGKRGLRLSGPSGEGVIQMMSLEFSSVHPPLEAVTSEHFVT